jgi:protein-disulfide isomerase
MRHTLAFLTAGIVLAACARSDAPAGGTLATLGSSAADSTVLLATIGAERITLADIADRTGDALQQLETKYLQSRSEAVQTALSEIVRARLFAAEAQRKQQPIDALVAAEGAAGGLEPSPEEVSAWYAENRDRLGGRSFDELKGQIAEFLRGERREQAAQRLEARLRKEQNVRVTFEPFRLTFNEERSPAKGSANSPVTLVEFSDFECPYCGAFFPTLQRIEREFGDRVRIVYKQFPIPGLHPRAIKAAEASLCAHDQGKFWAMHDLMFTEQSRLAVDELKEKARRAGLDAARFDECLDSGRMGAAVQADVAEGTRAGVTGTPSLFINGVAMPSGAPPYELVAAALQRELDRLQSR